jgi:hypothetical protein
MSVGASRRQAGGTIAGGRRAIQNEAGAMEGAPSEAAVTAREHAAPPARCQAADCGMRGSTPPLPNRWSRSMERDEAPGRARKRGTTTPCRTSLARRGPKRVTPCARRPELSSRADQKLLQARPWRVNTLAPLVFKLTFLRAARECLRYLKRTRVWSVAS